MTNYIQTRAGLLVPLAEFAEDPAPPGQPERGEIASISRDINRFLFGGALENLDETLKTRGRGKGLKIYDELERDAHAGAVLRKRKLAVTSRPWRVDAASDSRADKKAADLVSRQLKGLGFDGLTEKLLDATLKGFSVGEVIWEIRGAEIWAAQVKARDQRRFTFDEQEKLRLLTRSDLMLGELMPERKFIVHRFGAKDESPYGLGLGHALFWPVFFKRQGLGFWLVFADKFGAPTAIGKYPAGTTRTDQAKLLASLNAIAQDAGIVVQDGMTVEFLEAARASSIDTYEKLVRYMDEQVSECVLGETMSTTSAGAGLGSNQASVHNEVRLEVAQADSDMLADTLNATLVRWIVDLNMPGADYPFVCRDFDEPEDLQQRSQVDKVLHEMGYEPVSIEQINETYGGKWQKKAAPAPLGKPAPGALDAPGPQFAEGAQPQDPVASETATLATAAAPEWEAMIAAISKEVEAATDMATLARRLTDLYGGLDTEALANLMAAAFALAQLKGMADAKGDA